MTRTNLMYRLLLMTLCGTLVLGYTSTLIAEGRKGVLIDARPPSNGSSQFNAPVSASDSPGAMENSTGSETNANSLPAVKEPILVRVTGYAVFEPGKKNAMRERLAAIRASRLDAYRTLAERIYGLSLSGQSKVKDFEVKNDHFDVQVDSVVRGARVVSITENPKTGIETVLEVELPGNFQDCLNQVNQFRYRADCIRPISSMRLSEQAQLASQRAESPRSMSSMYHLN